MSIAVAARRWLNAMIGQMTVPNGDGAVMRAPSDDVNPTGWIATQPLQFQRFATNPDELIAYQNDTVDFVDITNSVRYRRVNDAWSTKPLALDGLRTGVLFLSEPNHVLVYCSPSDGLPVVLNTDAEES